MKLSDSDLALYRHVGHLTVPGLFEARADRGGGRPTSRPGARSSWPSCRRRSAPGTSTAASRRAPCCASWTTRTTTARRCAGWRRRRRWWSMVESIIGPGVSVYFSQIFFKPPEGGGPKPAHQDNYYFGPNDPEGVVTAWVALDDATLENGCLYFGEGTQPRPGVPARGAGRRALQPAAAGRDPAAPADDARRRCCAAACPSTTATPSTSRPPTCRRAGAAPARCTTSTRTPASCTRRCPTTTR